MRNILLIVVLLLSHLTVAAKSIEEAAIDPDITVNSAVCQLYAVHDKGLNHSQFFTITLDNHQINNLGPVYKGYDIEALAIHPETNMIYAASGNDVAIGNLPGHLYLVDGQTGDLFSIGSTGFEEIGDLAFGSDGRLWAWAKGVGLIEIEPTMGAGTLILPAHPKVLIEGLTLSKGAGTVFFGTANTDLWRYDLETDNLEIVCTSLLGETEALEMLASDLLLLGAHQDETFSLHVFNPHVCKIIADAAIPTNRFDDVEGIALPTKACSQEPSSKMRTIATPGTINYYPEAVVATAKALAQKDYYDLSNYYLWG